MKCDVVIPHYGEDEVLDKCLKSFENDENVSDIFVENNNEINLGFSKAVNNGICNSLDNKKSDFVCIVNNDTQALELPFSALIDSCKDGGISGPMVVHSSDHDRIVHAGAEQCFPFGVHRHGVRSLGHHSESAKVKWLSFVVVMIDKDVFREIGLLDQKMFLIGSDADFCYRARYAGFSCWYCPTSVWAHDIGESGEPTSQESLTIQRKDMWRFHRKWLGNGAFQELDTEVME